MDAHAVAHPSDETLRSYGLGRLDDDAARAVDRHLESCPECRRRVAVVSADSFLGRLRDAGVRPAPVGSMSSATDGLPLPAGGGDPPPDAPPSPATLPPGLADHPDYRILRELGRGGMGVVYLAENTLLGRLEVLKVVGAHLISRPGVLERFHREIRAAARLHHPNIVTVHAALRLGESLVLAMEYVEGHDLAQRVQDRGPLPVAHACNFIHQAAIGLQHAHERGMVHRDIKPANLILTREGKRPVVKLLDFGLAKVNSEGQEENDRMLTREGQTLGTPDFIAPEQIRDALSADIRADIYSLGCTLYYLLSGRPPFVGDTLWDLYQAHFSMQAAPLNLARPDVPAELAALVAKMMAKRPARRFQAPGDVAAALVPFFQTARAGAPAPKATPASGAAAPEAAAPSRPPAAIPPPLPPSAAKPAVPASSPASILDGLIDLRETDPLHDRLLDAPHLSPSPGRRSWPIAAAAAVFAAILLGIITITIRTRDGKTKIAVPDAGAVITIQPAAKRGVATKAEPDGRSPAPAPSRPPTEETLAILYKEDDGTPVPPADLQGLRMEINGERYAVKRGDKVEAAGIMKWAPTTSPRSVDLIVEEGPGAGETWPGIYEWDGDVLRLCANSHGGPRPTAFRTEGGSGCYLFIAHHIRPAARSGIAGAARPGVKDTWEFLAMEDHGRPSPRSSSEGARVYIDGDRFVTVRGDGNTQKGIMKWDPAKPSGQVDLIITEGDGAGKTWPGIYKWEGDMLRMCLDPGGHRPTAFDTEPGSSRFLAVYRRLPQ